MKGTGKRPWPKPFEFLQQVRAEARKVTWADAPRDVVSTGLVILMVIVASLFFVAVDWTIKNVLGFHPDYRQIGLTLLDGPEDSNWGKAPSWRTTDAEVEMSNRGISFTPIRTSKRSCGIHPRAGVAARAFA